jgi:hypothetical protein
MAGRWRRASASTAPSRKDVKVPDGFIPRQVDGVSDGKSPPLPRLLWGLDHSGHAQTGCQSTYDIADDAGCEGRWSTSHAPPQCQVASELIEAAPASVRVDRPNRSPH